MCANRLKYLDILYERKPKVYKPMLSLQCFTLSLYFKMT